jgi:threonylcarbamoyladenosine tRNA methylthiotransferase MtaB
MRISAHTLGCKLNNAETSTILGQFRELGWEIGNPEDSDFFLLNTCTVTENAERECRQLVRRVMRKNPNAFVAITGCYAQLRPEEIASIDGVDVVFGTKEKFDILRYVTNFEKLDEPHIFSSPIEEATDYHLAATGNTDERTRAFLKVQDGCDYNCSFCTIPLARGESRSGAIEEILSEARRLSSEGFREIVLSGVNVGDFGRKTGSSFLELISALEADGDVTARMRVSSIEPNLLTDEIISLVASSKKFCPHFHVPLQSGSARILRLMQRRYTKDIYRSRIERIKEMMPDAGIGADVIVGFPGETDEDFAESYEFIHSLDISYLHVFTYSERPLTKAAAMEGRIAIQKRKERNAMLRILSEKKKQAFYRSQIGKEGTVLVERSPLCGGRNNSREGFTENYVRVCLQEPLSETAELIRVLYIASEIEAVLAKPLEVISHRDELSLLPILQ